MGALAITATLTVACGSSPSTGAASPSPSESATGEKVAVATDAKLGQILVDDKGLTLYLFVADTGTASTCYSSCATIWPPVLTTGAPQAGTGVNAPIKGVVELMADNTARGEPTYRAVVKLSAKHSNVSS